MSTTAKPRVRVPKSVKRGEAFEIRTLITHPMESGQRKDDSGKTIPRKILNKFVCTLDGEMVFTAELAPAVAANPYLAFFCRAEKSGTLRFAWTDDDGTVIVEEAAVNVA
ncbi:MAG: thiosulfate oxidation carrier complex protein SoxZ [Alphaproteobacteria bacterium]|nr:thiosulfate oxidation carrier complex protein SoxZ [Alphaproteobacteria bacterium]